MEIGEGGEREEGLAKAPLKEDGVVTEEDEEREEAEETEFVLDVALVFALGVTRRDPGEPTEALLVGEREDDEDDGGEEEAKLGEARGVLFGDVTALDLDDDGEDDDDKKEEFGVEEVVEVEVLVVGDTTAVEVVLARLRMAAARLVLFGVL